MKTDIKLIALDVDGTIMDSRFQISQKVISTVKKAVNAGVKVVISSGRMYKAAVPNALQVGINTPLIVYHGSLIKEFYNSDRVLLDIPISGSITKELLKDLRKFSVQINLFNNDELYVEAESPILREYVSKRNINYNKVNFLEEIENLNPNKINAIDYDANKVLFIRKTLSEKYGNVLNVTASSPQFCEIVDKKASKGNAVNFLANLWGIKKSEILAIGDMDNDIELFEAAGISVAMGNAVETLKKASDYITETVDNDGAALAIEKFVFGSA